MARPNVVLIVLDAVRADHLSCYGYNRETSPAIDALADEGLRFTNAFSNSNWTGEAHPPIFTGLLPSHSGIYGDNLSFPDDAELLTEILHGAGYRTCGTSAGAHIRQGRGYDRGFDDFRETHRIQPSVETFRKLLTEPAYRKQARFTLTRGPDDKTLYKFEAVKRFIANTSDPVFAFFNCKTAHYPYNPPRPYKEKFCSDLDRPRYEFLERLFSALGRQTQDIPDVDIDTCRTNPMEFMADEFNLTDREWEVVESWYDGAIAYLDHRIGEFVSSLRERGELEETYLIVTADHGEMFGERGMTGHQFSLSDSLLHVPLIVRPPGGTDGREITERVSLVDLFNTILAMADLPQRERGHSANLLGTEGVVHHYTFAEIGNKEVQWLKDTYGGFDYPGPVGPLQSIRDDEFKLIWDRDNHLELYRWQEDPREQEEVSDEYPEVTESLSEILAEETEPMASGGSGRCERDEELEETLKHLGYR